MSSSSMVTRVPGSSEKLLRTIAFATRIRLPGPLQLSEHRLVGRGGLLDQLPRLGRAVAPQSPRQLALADLVWRQRQRYHPYIVSRKASGCNSQAVGFASLWREKPDAAES